MKVAVTPPETMAPAPPPPAARREPAAPPKPAVARISPGAEVRTVLNSYTRPLTPFQQQLPLDQDAISPAHSKRKPSVLQLEPVMAAAITATASKPSTAATEVYSRAGSGQGGAKARGRKNKKLEAATILRDLGHQLETSRSGVGGTDGGLAGQGPRMKPRMLEASVSLRNLCRKLESSQSMPAVHVKRDLRMRQAKEGVFDLRQLDRRVASSRKAQAGPPHYTCGPRETAAQRRAADADKPTGRAPRSTAKVHEPAGRGEARDEPAVVTHSPNRRAVLARLRKKDGGQQRRPSPEASQSPPDRMSLDAQVQGIKCHSARGDEHEERKGEPLLTPSSAAQRRASSEPPGLPHPSADATAQVGPWASPRAREGAHRAGLEPSPSPMAVVARPSLSPHRVAISKCFMLSKDSLGEVHKDSIVRALETYGVAAPNPILAAEVFDKVTSYNSLNLDEFIRFVTWYEAREEAVASSLFAKFNTSGGKMPAAEVSKLLAACGVTPMEHVVQAIMDEVRSVDKANAARAHARVGRRQRAMEAIKSESEGLDQQDAKSMVSAREPRSGTILERGEGERVEGEGGEAADGEATGAEAAVEEVAREEAAGDERDDVQGEAEKGEVEADELRVRPPEGEKGDDASEEDEEEGLTYYQFKLVLETIRIREGFSRAEVDQFMRMFDDYDTSGDQKLDAREIMGVLCHLGYAIDIKGVTSIIHEMKGNDSDTLERTEFLIFMRKAREREIHVVRSLFTDSDTDGSQGISFSELFSMLGSLGYVPQAKTIQESAENIGLTKIVDRDLSFHEVWQFLEVYRIHHGLSQQDYQEVEMTYRRFDADGNGVLEPSEVGKLFRFMGYPITYHACMRLMSKVDSSHIDLDEFVELVRKYREKQTKTIFSELAAEAKSDEYTNLLKKEDEHAIEYSADSAWARMPTMARAPSMMRPTRSFKMPTSVAKAMTMLEEGRQAVKSNFGFGHDQLEELEACFKLYDADNSGEISHFELHPLFQDLFPELTTMGASSTSRRELLRLFDQVDGNHNRALDFREFLQLVRRWLDYQDGVRYSQERQAVEQTGFTPREVADFRELFMGEDGNRSSISNDELQEMLQRVVPLGHRNSGRLKVIFEDMAPAYGSGERRADFSIFLLIMKRLLDTNFAGISDISSAPRPRSR